MLSNAKQKSLGKEEKCKLKYRAGPSDYTGEDFAHCQTCEGLSERKHCERNCGDRKHDTEYTRFLGFENRPPCECGRFLLNPMHLIPVPEHEGAVFALAPDGTCRVLPTNLIQSLPPPSYTEHNPMICKFGDRCQPRLAKEKRNFCRFIHLKNEANWKELSYLIPHFNYTKSCMIAGRKDERLGVDVFFRIRMHEKDNYLLVSGARILKTRGSAQLSHGDEISYCGRYFEGDTLCHNFQHHGFCPWGAHCRYVHFTEDPYNTEVSIRSAPLPDEVNMESYMY